MKWICLDLNYFGFHSKKKKVVGDHEMTILCNVTWWPLKAASMEPIWLSGSLNACRAWQRDRSQLHTRWLRESTVLLSIYKTYVWHEPTRFPSIVNVIYWSLYIVIIIVYGKDKTFQLFINDLCVGNKKCNQDTELQITRLTSSLLP